jgi:hypothetical protein
MSEDELVRKLVARIESVVGDKLRDAEIPGARIAFDPLEAERAGAFVEDAMSIEDAEAAEDGTGRAATADTAPGVANDRRKED